MALKWISTVVAASALGAFIAANVISDRPVPLALNLALAAASASGTVAVVLAEYYQRVDSRLMAISDYLVNRLDEMSGRLGAIEDAANQRRLEAILSEPENPVVPMLPRRTGR